MFIELHNEKFNAVADTFGGELISFIDHTGMEYLWNGDETYWNGRSPHLFPIIGTLKNNKAFMGGDYYSMSKHGFARNNEFEVHEVSAASVTFVLRDNEDIYKMYPYHFSLYVTHSLLDHGFMTEYKIVNEGNETMHFNIGGHVGIRCPRKPGENFDDYEIVFDRKLTQSAYFPPNDDPILQEQLTTLLEASDLLSLDYQLFEKGAVIMDNIASPSLQLRNKNEKKGITFLYEGFPVLALWTFGWKKAPYLCLEPWHGLPAMMEDTDYLKDKPYMITLLPKEEKQLQYSLMI
jgi:galactose mutarotase-like enzyme